MLTKRAKAFICPWGAEGVYYLDVAESELLHLPASPLDKVAESIGAGDSFIGASLAGLSRGNVPLRAVLEAACEVASAKCSKQGFALSPQDQDAWQKKFRRERGGVGANAA
jgi:sugar/nucleoside kinase (ribokinase family)